MNTQETGTNTQETGFVKTGVVKTGRWIWGGMVGLKSQAAFAAKLLMCLLLTGVTNGVIGHFYNSYCVPHGIMGFMMGWVTLGSPACSAAAQLMSWGHQFVAGWWLGVVAIFISAVKDMGKGARVQLPMTAAA